MNEELLKFANQMLSYHQDIADALNTQPEYTLPPEALLTIQIGRIDVINEEMGKTIMKVLPR